MFLGLNGGYLWIENPISVVSLTLSHVKHQMKQGAYIDHANPSGLTALMTAAKFGEEAIVSYLIQQKADVNKSDRVHFSKYYITGRWQYCAEPGLHGGTGKRGQTSC
eukprot:1364031-Amorphochlora_amoeboformis.AAC.1